ncbi:MAG: SAM-dependent methyltransferase, partial [Pseudomonadota bacterium]|nr:SAM-dependent methyltransferase [Pseudomonadota bacterium]
KFGYYSTKQPFGKDGDFVTSPKISKLFSEMIGIWLITSWELFGKPKQIHIVELGPGDGSLTKELLNTFRKFPEFNSAKKIYLYEKSSFLRKIQRNNISDTSIRWIKNFKNITKYPVVFFGNEFFDAIPIKQFKKINGLFFEKNYTIDKNNQIKEVFKKISITNRKLIRSYKTLKNLNFIEFPKMGFQELKKMTDKVSKLTGCILLIDYGYLKSSNKNTLQSVIRHKKNKLLNNLGQADITSHVNFELLGEFFSKNNLKIKTTITQKQFLETLGIIERADILAKKMKFKEQSNLYLRLKRLLNPNLMGHLFKVILAYNFNKDNFIGFK